MRLAVIALVLAPLLLAACSPDVTPPPTTGWTIETVLVPPVDDFFREPGYSVAVDGDTVVVGAPYQLVTYDGSPVPDLPDLPPIEAFVFVQRDGAWRERATLSPPSPPSGEPEEFFFGTDVAVSGDILLVNAPVFDGYDLKVGPVHAFTRQGDEWTSEGLLPLLPDPAPYAGRVVLSGHRALLANWDRPYGFEPEPDRGAAYVFARDEGGAWTLEAKAHSERHLGRVRFGC
jgi:hypothetical protein